MSECAELHTMTERGESGSLSLLFTSKVPVVSSSIVYESATAIGSALTVLKNMSERGSERE